VGSLRSLVADAQRVVVVSPHLDDAVLSLGASIASWSRAGVAVQALTVLGCDPDSDAPAGGWDRRGGFATEGESAVARREEDSRACALLGATPIWLPFGSVDYERHGDEGDVRRAVADALGGADLVLLPGFPLSHPDHEWLVRRLVSDFESDTRLALYAEQPYARRAGVAPEVPQWLVAATAAAAFEAAHTRLRDRLAKWRAIRAYGSQLPLLGMRRSLQNGAHRYAFAPEWITGGAEAD
jgi:LmbE family N-acetylglucosaminyl deacetylase